MACTLDYLSLSGMAPAYLAADCQLVSDEGRRQLRSANSRTCRQTDLQQLWTQEGFGGRGNEDPPNSQKYTKKVHTVCISKIQGNFITL